MRYPSNIREEELKNRVAADFFHKYDCMGIIEKIDFSVKVKNQSIFDEYLLWAEAKKSATDIIAMLAQLVLTVPCDIYNEKEKFEGVKIFHSS
ncbi:hypothetical protein R83H12_01139 [Fibrobacteria bacterium R8-3-H12]